MKVKKTVCNRCKCKIIEGQKKVVCCIVEQPTCMQCGKYPCKWCGGAYTMRRSVSICDFCKELPNPKGSSLLENNQIICSACIANSYCWVYRENIKNNFSVDVSIFTNKTYTFLQMKQFFSNICIQCGLKEQEFPNNFKQEKGYYLKQNFIVCNSCFQSDDYYKNLFQVCQNCKSCLRVGKPHFCTNNFLKPPSLYNFESNELRKSQEKKEEDMNEKQHISKSNNENKLSFLSSSNAEDIVKEIDIEIGEIADTPKQCFRCECMLQKETTYRVQDLRKSLSELILSRTYNREYCKLCYLQEVEIMKKEFTRQLLPWTPSRNLSFLDDSRIKTYTNISQL